MMHFDFLKKEKRQDFCDAYLRVRPEATQVALQVTMGHQLHHYQCGLTFGHHT